MNSHTVINAIDSIRAQAEPINLANREIIIYNLVFSYQLMKASEDLLIEATDALEIYLTGMDDELRDYFEKHLTEERDHVQWLYDDLISSGVDAESIPIMRKASEMAGSMFYQIKYCSAESLLGYMAVLEGNPIPLDTLAQLEVIHGETMFRTLRYHAHHDVEHRQVIYNMIDKYYTPNILTAAVWAQQNLNEFAIHTNKIYS